MNPDTQLLLKEIQKLSVEQATIQKQLSNQKDLLERKWHRRFTVQDAACEASPGVLVPSLSAADGVEVVADNWGGFFEQPADNCSDNWGGLFEQPAHILEEPAATDAADDADITLEFDPADHGLLLGADSLADIQVHQFTSTNLDAPLDVVQKLAQCGPVDIEYIPTSAAFSTSSFTTVHASILTREEFVSGKGGDATTYPGPNAAIFADQIRYNADAEPDPEPEAEASVGRSTQMMLAKGQILFVSSSPIVSNSASSSGPAYRAPHPASAAPYPLVVLKVCAAADSLYGVYSEHIVVSHMLSMQAHACPALRQQQARGQVPIPRRQRSTGMNVVFVGAEMASWSTIGGLGDVLGGLPPAMAAKGSHGMTWSTHVAKATPTSSTTSTLPGASTPSLAMLSSISLEHASLGARQVFEELSLHADIFCNICIGFELPSRMSLGVDQHQPWPPPNELRLMGCDAELRPTPWPSFYMAVRNSATGHPGRL